MTEPSQTEVNGRKADGTFAKGNKIARGNPHAKKVAQFKARLYDAITEEDFTAIISALVAQAKTGDIAACREILDRLLGKPQAELQITNALEAQEKRLLSLFVDLIISNVTDADQLAKISESLKTLFSDERDSNE